MHLLGSLLLLECIHFFVFDILTRSVDLKSVQGLLERALQGFDSSPGLDSMCNVKNVIRPETVKPDRMVRPRMALPVRRTA